MKTLIILRKNRKLTQQDVANYLGISRQAYANYETGNREPDINTLKKLSDYFGVSIDTLVSAPLNLQLFADRTVPATTLRAGMPGNFYGDDASKYEPRTNVLEIDANNVRFVPVLESVSAGLGAIAMNDIIDYQPIYFNHPSEAPEHICLKVKGDSMYPKIEDGDVILIHKQESVDSGSLAVVLLDGDEGLVKRIEYGEGWIELHSVNPMYKSMRFDGPDVLRIRVVGLVKKIIKSV